MHVSVVAEAGSAQTYIQQQHRFRGIIADFKSRRFVEKRSVPASRRFRTALNQLYLDVRSKLSPSQYPDFLDWAQDMLSTQLPELANTPTRYDNLSGIFPKAPIVEFEIELRWIAERLRSEREKVHKFLVFKDIVSQSVISSNYNGALTALDALFEIYGANLWSIQLRLALEQQVGGLERQKKYSAQVRSVYKSGLLGFTTYHTSVRNEDRTTIYKYKDDIERRIANHTYYDEATRTYMRYRLKNELTTSYSQLADVLRIEQNHDILDIYETFVAVMQEVVGWDSKGIHDLVTECIEISQVSDYRLEKIRLAINSTKCSSLSNRSTQLSDALFSGRGRDAMKLACSIVNCDPWQIIYSGFAKASSDRTTRGPLSPSTLDRWIAAAMAGSGEEGDYAAQAAKLCLNFNGLSFAAGVGEFLSQARRDRPDSLWRPWLIGLHSAAYGIEDTVGAPLSSNAVFPDTPTSNAWTLVRSGDCPAVEAMAVAPLARAVYHLSQANADEACQLLNTKQENTPVSLRALWQMALLHSFHAIGDRPQKIALIASEGARNASYFNMFPVVQSLTDCAWNDYKSVTSPLAAPIALHLLWTQTENSQTASQLRFATGAALRKLGVTRPSALYDKQEEIPSHELFYFLHHVCVPEILDVTRLFSSSREVLEERRNIYLTLSELRPDLADEFTGEAVLISHNLALDEGRWIVDRTRIHVEDVAFVRWASRELQEDYDRYRDLEPVNIDAPQSFEDVLRELDDNTVTRRSFSPDNEADAVLMSVVRRAGDEFLTNATFGLDFYLAKNVRHHSFIGLIRGPLEVSELITTRETETSAYHPNRVWLDRFQTLDTADRNSLEEALRNFSARFDDILLDAKDKYFHVRTVEHPMGMLFIPYSDVLYSLVRVWLTLELDITTFFRFLINVFWISLEQSLQGVRELISLNLKGALVEEFNGLRSTVRQIAESDPVFLDFDSEVGKRSAEVQAKLDEASQWFVHSGALASRHLFTLEQILEVGLEATLTTQRGYTPNISRSTDGELSLDAANLVFVHDVLFVGLGNAKKHSGLSSPQIDIGARWNAASNTLAIEIVSDCKASAKAEKQKKANEVRQLVTTGAYSRHTRKDDGSGFAKLAAIVAQSDRGKIEFGFQPNGRFRLEVTYAVVLQPRERPDV